MPLFLIYLLYVLNTIQIIGGIPATAFSYHTFKGNETDYLALLAIKSMITLDPHKVLNSWNESVHYCQWEGVVCGRRHKRVTTLNLTTKSLVGTLSPFVGNLSFLHELLLPNNTFRGHIPSEIGRLHRLQTLNFLFNSFEGEIPANISGCLHLSKLYLSRNKLVGKIPSELRFLNRLTDLTLDYNNLVGNDLSPISNLTSLQKLYLSGQTEQGGAGFQGRIPDFIGKFNDLTDLALGGNSFTGVIPLSLYNLSNIQKFSLSDNQLQGSLSPDIGIYFPQLQYFQINYNHFSGLIPSSFSNLSKLEMLTLGFNNFTGKFLFDGRNMQNLNRLDLDKASLGRNEADDLNFLDSLVNCSHLEVLAFRYNYFGGILPPSIANLSTKLLWFDFSYNLLSGSIPFGLGNRMHLKFVVLNDNQFTGTIPADIGTLPRLQYVVFSNNQLSGSIPLSLGNLSWLSYLDLSNNKLKGTVPAILGNCKGLLNICLNQNNLVGNVPQQLFHASSLVTLDLSNNYLQGSIPSDIGYIKNLVSVDMSNNNLSGTIPGSIGQCLSLVEFYLKGNAFVGLIPPSFSHLKDLQFLDLSGNKLYGKVPNFFSNFSFLTLLNLSYNDFEGEIPTNGVFTNISGVSLVGNNKLCGGIPQLNFPSCPTSKPRGDNKVRVIVIAVLTSCLFVGMAILLSVYLLCSKRRTTSSTGTLFKEPFIKVSYDMILKATDSFSPGKLIGSGSFGSVYRGNLHLDGVEKVVAIKVINNQRKGAAKSFIAECQALRLIRHRNLVRVITACSSIDFQGNAFNALIYELMSKDSLEKWLNSNREDEDQLPYLSLQQRLNIAIDVAHALDYIHNGNDPPIIHCDLKPSNILLDENMTAHVGDFGLVKLIPEISEQLHNSSSIGVRGTIGYAAPEYGLGASVSTAADVYSYGIILLEMMTAKKSTDLMFEGDMSLHKLAELALATDHVLEIIDPELKVVDEEERNMDLNDTTGACITKCVFECVTSMVTTGVRCSSELPQERMDIKDVIRQLQSQRDQLLLCGRQHRCQHLF